MHVLHSLAGECHGRARDDPLANWLEIGSSDCVHPVGGLNERRKMEDGKVEHELKLGEMIGYGIGRF